MSSKPTIVLVPGAWHSPSHYDALIQRLSSAGYKTLPVSLASVGASPPLEDFQPDVDNIRAAIKKVVDAGEDAVIVSHSYGSFPTIEAIEGYQKKDDQPGVSHFFFCTSFVPPTGASLYDMLGGNPLPWFLISDDKMIVNPDDPRKVFYGDCSEEDIQTAIAGLKPFSHKVFSSKSKSQGWKEVPCTYMYCEDDQAIPLEVQQGMVTASGVPFQTVSYKASHSPFLSKPDETALEVRRAAGEAV